MIARGDNEAPPQWLPRPYPLQRDEHWMRRCVEVASRAGVDDVPVGAVVIGPNGQELASAANRREADSDPLAHAEVLALRAAATRLGDRWRLERCTLVVSLEPCTMCAGAAVAARVGRIVFGAYEPRTGACGSVFDVVRDRRLVHRPQLRGGVLATECSSLVEDFFRNKR